MSRVLLAGESWFSYTVHQKGFDTFTTSEYTEGAGEFLAALRGAGHDVTYVPAHEVHTRLDGEDAFDAFDVIVISDVGANTFQLAPRTFNRSEPSPDKAELVRRRVESGGGLLMVGGYLTFTGIAPGRSCSASTRSPSATGRPCSPSAPAGRCSSSASTARAARPPSPPTSPRTGRRRRSSPGAATPASSTSSSAGSPARRVEILR
jgi:hypothetical protein